MLSGILLNPWSGWKPFLLDKPNLVLKMLVNTVDKRGTTIYPLEDISEQLWIKEKMTQTAVPIWLDVVVDWISYDGQEHGVAQRRHVHPQTFNQQLQAGQNSVTQLTRLHVEGPLQHNHGCRIFQHAHLQQITRQHQKEFMAKSQNENKSIFCSQFNMNFQTSLKFLPQRPENASVLSFHFMICNFGQKQNNLVWPWIS